MLIAFLVVIVIVALAELGSWVFDRLPLPIGLTIFVAICLIDVALVIALVRLLNPGA